MTEELPEYTDEGYADEEDFQGIGETTDISNLYNPLYQNTSWDFGGVPRNTEAVDDDEVYDEDAASDMPNLGSNGAGDLDNRMLEDFGDELTQGMHPGTPEEVLATLGGEGGDGDVANVLLDDEVPTGMVGQQHVKVD
jgi:ubiquitin carboxyl-terminal hydrolase 4/11/15